jgi:hypothetical protein
MKTAVAAVFDTLRAYDFVAVVTVNNETGPQLLTTPSGIGFVSVFRRHIRAFDQQISDRMWKSAKVSLKVVNYQ